MYVKQGSNSVIDILFGNDECLIFFCALESPSLIGQTPLHIHTLVYSQILAKFDNFSENEDNDKLQLGI